MDAELLSEVYLAMTRGQDSLAIGLDATTHADEGRAAPVRPAHLKVLRATASETEAHGRIVAGIDAASGGKAAWKRMASSEA
jgi:DNA polymerase-3 subunit epsilon